MASPNENGPLSSPPQTGNRSRASSNVTGEGRPRQGSTTSIGRDRSSTGGSQGRLRSGSLRFLESNPGSGFWHRTGEDMAMAPTLGEIRGGAYTADGWHEEGQRESRGETPHAIVAHQQRRLSRINSGLTRTDTSRSLATPTAPAGPLAETQEEHEYAAYGISTPNSRRASKEEVRESTPAEKIQAEVNEINAPPSSSTSLSAKADKPTVSQTDKDQTVTTHPLTHETDETGTYPNGYHFPPKHTWQESTMIGLKALWKFTLTPIGFLVVLYALNVVAWGAMIFFVLLKACPAMCHPSCDALSSERKKWIERDSQILNGLFCVTGLGLIPWRFRDLYFILQYRLFGNNRGLRALAGLNRGWFRLEGSQDLEEHMGPPPDPKKKPVPEGDAPPEYVYSEQELDTMWENPAVPLPIWRMPKAPLTGNRAPPTKVWKMDLVIWLYIWNTIFQGCLCGVMWGFNRFNRPSWTTALFIVTACLVGMGAGWVVFAEGKRVKKIEGVGISDADRVKMMKMDEEAKAAGLVEKNPSVFKKDWDSNGKTMK